MLTTTANVFEGGDVGCGLSVLSPAWIVPPLKSNYEESTFSKIFMTYRGLASFLHMFTNSSSVIVLGAVTLRSVISSSNDALGASWTVDGLEECKRQDVIADISKTEDDDTTALRQ
jgi:hypothetical protein